MLNMIKLDWLGMKVYHKRFILIPLGICYMGFLNELLILPCTVFFMLSFSVNPFAMEEKGKLDNLYLSLPITRKTIVRARLSLSLIMLGLGMALGTVMTIIMSKLLYGHNEIFIHFFQADFNSMCLLICGSLLFYAIMNLSTFPILFKIGYAKGKVFGFYIPVGAMVFLFSGINFIAYFNDSFYDKAIAAIEWALEHTMGTAAIMLAAAVLALAISYVLSQRLYAKREL